MWDLSFHSWPLQVLAHVEALQLTLMGALHVLNLLAGMQDDAV